jgi:hypothetical protein
MTTLTVVLINVHAHLIFFCEFQFLTNQRKFEQERLNFENTLYSFNIMLSYLRGDSRIVSDLFTKI